MAQTTITTMMLFLCVSLFPTAVLGQVTACSIGENWGELLSTFTAAAASTQLSVIGTITVQSGGDCPSSWRAYQTIELGPSLSCFAAPVIVAVGNVTNVETVTYFYEDCPVVTGAVSPTITVNESHWVQTDSEGGSVFGLTSSVITLPSLASSTVTSSGTGGSTGSDSASAGASGTSTTPTTSTTPSSTTSTTISPSASGGTEITITGGSTQTIVTGGSTETIVTGGGTETTIGSTGTQTDNVFVTKGTTTDGTPTGTNSKTSSTGTQASAASRIENGARIACLAVAALLCFALLEI